MKFPRETALRLAFLLIGLTTGLAMNRYIPALGRPSVDATAVESEMELTNGSQSSAKNGNSRETGKDRKLANEASLTPEQRVRAKYETAMRDPSKHRRLSRFLHELESMTAADAPEILKLIGQLDREGMHFSSEWPAFIRRWGEVDGPAAAEHAMKNQKEGWVKSGIKDIFSGWAATDHIQAAAWLNDHGESPLFDFALQGIVSGISEMDPSTATKVAIDSLPPNKPELAAQLAEQITEAVVRQQKRSGMLEWYDTLPSTAGENDDLKRAAFGHVWWRLNHADATQARTWLASQADKPWRNDLQYSIAMRNMIAHSPAAALDWAGSIPPSPNTGQWPGVLETLSEWSQLEPAELQAYVKKLPNNEFGNFVRQVTPQNR